MRLECEHGAALGGEELSEGDGVDTHVGAGFNDYSARRVGEGQELEEEIDFKLAALAVVEERLAHEDVIAVDEHGAMSSGNELVVGADRYALHGNLGEARQGPFA